jgi:peptidoglycan/xylan/chitin deacetylase (PgdA/CDA1 family)
MATKIFSRISVILVPGIIASLVACTTLSTAPVPSSLTAAPAVEPKAPWAWEDAEMPDRDLASAINVAGGIIYNGKLKAEGSVPEFTLPSELRLIPEPMQPIALHYANMGPGEISITIDDGPSPEANAFVLKTLKDHGVKAVFFLVGRRIKTHPEMVENILRDGHAVGIHTWSHPLMTKISLVTAAKEIDDTYMLLKRIVDKMNVKEHPEKPYRIQPFFRFPYGAGANVPALQALLKQRNLANFHWAMTSKDSEIPKDGSVCLNTEVGMLEKYSRGLFLTHETHPAGVKALPYFLEQLHNRGYKTVYFESDPSGKEGATPKN